MPVPVPRPPDASFDPLYDIPGTEVVESWQVEWLGGTWDFPSATLPQTKPGGYVNLYLSSVPVPTREAWEAAASLATGVQHGPGRTEGELNNLPFEVPAGTYYVSANWYSTELVDPSVLPEILLPDGVTFLPRPSADEENDDPDPQQVGFIGRSPDQSDPENYTLGGGLRGTLTAPNGTRYRLVVNNDGTLGTAPA